EELRLKEQQQLDTLHQRLKAEIASFAVGQQSMGETVSPLTAGDLDGLLLQLEGAKPVGRLVIAMETILKGESDIELRDGDRIVIPKRPSEVSIIGEVNYPTSHLANADYSVDDYIKRSGGMTKLADAGATYVVRSNGMVLSDVAGGLFGGGYTPEVGDTIVVPQDMERVRPMTMWTSVSQILYQLGVAAAAWNTVGVL
ncbi:MAG: capsule biosynthesis GfcC family protein, partial [Gammaproteobacteria bacterium]|nr:capsule biosynthesis GfcC family protein [Gammaproteobacteria bacterium]